MKSTVSSLLLILASLLNTNSLMGQARLILNGAKINITNGAALILNNGAANAITRIDGHIISEDQNNIIKWAIGTNVDSYIIPWGLGTSAYLPLSFTTSSAAGNGSFIFSTYQTGWQNSSSLPDGVTNVLRNGMDNSAYLLDRFWQINAQNYSSKPVLSNLSFGYLDIEHTVPNNTISEAFLSAQRWNDNSNTWSDISPVGVADVTSNTVNVPTLPASDLYKWWVLVDNAFPLPLNFLSFSLQNIDRQANLVWSTTNEVNVRDFDVERSYNGINYQSIGTVSAYNNGNSTNYYSFTDPSSLTGRTYFRIKQNDANGMFTYSEIRTITTQEKEPIQFYPNPVRDGKIIINTMHVPVGTYTFTLFDLQSKQVFSKTLYFNKNLIEVNLNSHLQNGSYIAIISNPNFFVSQKIIILRN